MQELSVSKFDPLKAEISSLVENIKNTVANATGATGYELMKENKKILQSRRVDIVRDLKAERDGAIKFQKAVIEVEKDLLKLIADVEDPLDEKIKGIDEARKREERKALLPDRKEKLATISLDLTDDELLAMDEKTFAEYFLNRKTEYLEEKQRRIDEENRRIEAERQEAEAAKRREIEIEEARKEAAERARKEAEEKAEREKQAILEDAERKERERIAVEERAKVEEEARIRREQEEREKLEKRKAYQRFRAEHGYTEENKSEYIEQNVGSKIVLFKKVGEFKL